MEPDYLPRLRFYREEVKHEFNLLAMRTTILVTCQSFLVVPFAILHTATRFDLVFVPALMIAILGFVTSTLIKQPIFTAHRIIDEWLLKQRQLLAEVSEDDFKTSRDSRAAAQSTGKDPDHVESLRFSKYGPLTFQIFWVASMVWIVIRVFL